MSVPVPGYHTWMNVALLSLSQPCRLSLVDRKYKGYRGKRFPALDPLPSVTAGLRIRT